MSSDDREQTDEPTAAEMPGDPVEVDEPDASTVDPLRAAETVDRPRRGGMTAIILSVVLFALLLGGAYYWHQYRYVPALAVLGQDVAGASAGQANLVAQLDATRAGIDTVSADASGAMTEVAALGAKIASTVQAQADLRHSVSALYAKETQTSVDWVLAEAEYLVLAATQRLALERDIDTAIAALRAADQRLRSADHPDLIPIRDQLIKDITALEGVNRADVEGLAIYLAKTIDQVEALPTKPIAEEVTPFSTVRDGEYAAADWRRLGYAIWSDLVDLVEVKDADLPDSVLFDPELRYFLRQNLKLELASARLAVLRRDRANLEASVGLIKRLFAAYYDENDAGVKSIAARLDEAAKLELKPQLPNISGSLDVIRAQRANRSGAETAQ
jgi:uroporphyrin-3 C-methyltransferase